MDFCLLLLALGCTALCAYHLWLAVGAMEYEQPKRPLDARQNRLLVVILGEENEETIMQSCQSAVLQYYPKTAYDIAVLAAEISNENRQSLNQLYVTIIESNTLLEHPLMVWQQALEHCSREYNAVVFLRAGSLLSPPFLQQINDRLNNGFKVVQGHLMQENWENSTDWIFGLRQMIRSHIFCAGQAKRNRTARFQHSGIAVDYAFFDAFLKENTEKKPNMLDFELYCLEKRQSIPFDPKAVLYRQKGELNFLRKRMQSFFVQIYLARKILLGFAKQPSTNRKSRSLLLLDRCLPSRPTLYVLLWFGLLAAPQFMLLWLTGIGLHLATFGLSIPQRYWRDGRLAAHLMKMPFTPLKIALYNLKSLMQNGSISYQLKKQMPSAEPVTKTS